MPKVTPKGEVQTDGAGADTRGRGSSRTKRKLMPLRRADVCLSSSPIAVDHDTKEATKPACLNVGDDVQGRRSKRVATRGEASVTVAPVEERAAAPAASSAPKRLGKKAMPNTMRMIVCTSMHREEVEKVSEALVKLGNCAMEAKVSSQTTHVVCGDIKRTLNLLHGVARGCWVVGSSWIVESVEAGHWINEEPFELQTFPGIRQTRAARLTFGSHCEIFNNGDTYYVSSKTQPPPSDLEDLLKLCGANVTSAAKRASIVVTPRKLSHLTTKVKQVNEKWVLDSIQDNMLQDKTKYLYV